MFAIMGWRFGLLTFVSLAKLMAATSANGPSVPGTHPLVVDHLRPLQRYFVMCERCTWWSYQESHGTPWWPRESAPRGDLMLCHVQWIILCAVHCRSWQPYLQILSTLCSCSKDMNTYTVHAMLCCSIFPSCRVMYTVNWLFTITTEHMYM